VVLPVAHPVSGAIGQELSLRAHIAIAQRVIVILAFVEVAVVVIGTTITNDPIHAPLLQPVADHGREVTRIKSDGQGCEFEALELAIKSPQVGLAVVDVARRHVRIGDERMLAIDGAVIQVEEALRLTLSGHVARVLVGRADLDFFGLHHLIARFEWGFAMLRTISVNGRIQLG